MIIESTSNAVFKGLFELTKSKGIKEQRKALVSGEKITGEIVRNSKTPVQWIVSSKMDIPVAPVKPVVLSPDLFKQLDVGGTGKALLVCEVPEFQSLEELDSSLPALYIALSDPSNLGAMVRTCVAFGWQQIVLLQECAHPFLPKAIRGSSGACFHVRFFSGPSIQDLDDESVVALDSGGIPLKDYPLPKNAKILIGEEGKGVPASFPGVTVQIPISNQVDSLNATIAGSLLIYEWSRR